MCVWIFSVHTVRADRRCPGSSARGRRSAASVCYKRLPCCHSIALRGNMMPFHIEDPAGVNTSGFVSRYKFPGFGVCGSQGTVCTYSGIQGCMWAYFHGYPSSRERASMRPCVPASALRCICASVRPSVIDHMVSCFDIGFKPILVCIFAETRTMDVHLFANSLSKALCFTVWRQPNATSPHPKKCSFVEAAQIQTHVAPLWQSNIFGMRA